MAGNGALSRDKIFGIAQSLPSAPRVLSDLGVLLKDSNVHLERVADLIRRDTALAAHIIRISNSVAYGSSGEVKVGTVEDAVNRVGFQEVYRLVGLATTSRLTERTLKYYAVPTEPLRANMLYTALVCEALAEACGLDVRLAYTAGLMRTLGILVLDRVGDLLVGIEPYNHEAMGSYEAWEGRVFLFSNCEVGAMILSEWRFPTRTVEAVRDHYLLRDDDYENRFACLLNVAGGIVAATGYGLPGEYGYWEPTHRKLEVLNLSTRQIAKAAEKARSAFESFRAHIDLGPLRPPASISEPDEPKKPESLYAVRDEPSAKKKSTEQGPIAIGASLSRRTKGGAFSKAPFWWRKPYAHWPLAPRAVFFALTLTLGAGFTFASLVGCSTLIAFVSDHFGPLSQIQSVLTFASDLGASITHSIPASWSFGAAALFAVLYAVLFGLGTAAYRRLVLNR